MYRWPVVHQALSPLRPQCCPLRLGKVRGFHLHRGGRGYIHTQRRRIWLHHRRRSSHSRCALHTRVAFWARRLKFRECLTHNIIWHDAIFGTLTPHSIGLTLTLPPEFTTSRRSTNSSPSTNPAEPTSSTHSAGRPNGPRRSPMLPARIGPGQCAPPSDLSVWDNYLRAIVTHAAGKIRYWEIWNEPQSTEDYCGDIPTMVTMAQHASRIIKSIDPNALILSPAANGGPGPAWLASFLAAGGSNYVDVIAFHGYWSAQAEDVVGVIANFKAAMVANGAAGKPMWDTESSWAGFGTLPTPTMSAQVGFIAKDYILHWSQGAISLRMVRIRRRFRLGRSLEFHHRRVGGSRVL